MCKVKSWGVGGAGDEAVGVDFWGVGMLPNQSIPDILRDGDGEDGGPRWGTPGVGHGLGAAGDEECVGGGCCVGCHAEVEGTGAHVLRGGWIT